MKVKQSIPRELRYSKQDFDTEFPDDNVCLEYIKEQRWPDGIVFCGNEKCSRDRKHHRVSGRMAYACDYCGHHVYPLAGTIFEKSTTSLRTWFYAMYLMGSTRCGISAKQIQRETSVTYKTAWRMFRQIRTLLSEDIVLEGSSVEMDETYIGGKPRYIYSRKRGRGTKKIPVVGIVERQGRVVAKVMPNVKGSTVLRMIRKRVKPKSTIYTDEYTIYDGIKTMKGHYTHRRINHSSEGYVRGIVHTNSVEGFWSLIKRGISGVYHHVDRAYLQSYLDEYCFRYNRRHTGNLIFTSILERACGKAS
jgi:transposase